MELIQYATNNEDGCNESKWNKQKKRKKELQGVKRNTDNNTTHKALCIICQKN